MMDFIVYKLLISYYSVIYDTVLILYKYNLYDVNKLKV